MEKFTTKPGRLLQLGLLFGFFSFLLQDMNGQCECKKNGVLIEDVDPGAYYNVKSIKVDADGFVAWYGYTFQFACIADPLRFLEDFNYIIIYREKGTTEWIVDEFGGYIFQGYYLLHTGPFDPCKTYELRVTCPNCELDFPFPLKCWPYDQLQAYFNDPTNTFQNVSRIWEICYAPIEDQPIKNLKISSVDAANHSVVVKWDHLPGPATYSVDYRKTNSFQWISLGTTELYEFEINNLESCDEYQVRVRGKADNCCGETKFSQYAGLTFVMTDCVSTIESVDLVTGKSALIGWTPIGPTPNDYQIIWWPKDFPTNTSTATTTSPFYAITGLNPDMDYRVKVISNCGTQTCSGPSQVFTFHTNCELREPNNAFLTASPISFDVVHGNNNIWPAGDVDFFKFTPTGCDLIEIRTDDPDRPGPYDPFPETYYNDLPYILYDQNFHEVPKTDGYVDAKDLFHTDVHKVIPDQEYYLAVRGFSNASQNLNCYTVNAHPCWECDNLTSNGILGDDKIYSAPSTAYYSLIEDGYHVEWSVTGPAIFVNINNPSDRQLYFNGTGTVILTAKISNCAGESAIFQKEIVVSNECNVTGTYNAGPFNFPIREAGVNLLENLNYTITLDIPPGTLFDIYQRSGSATWVIEDNKIKVHQITSNLEIGIHLRTNNCAFDDSNYFTFHFDGDVPSNPIDPVGWLLSPNPTSNVLLVTPSIAPNTDLQSVPETVDIRIFNQNANLELYQQGSTRSSNSLNMSNLVPGNYTLQLGYGDCFKQFTVVKQ